MFHMKNPLHHWANTAPSSLFSCALGERERECCIIPEWCRGFIYLELKLGHPLHCMKPHPPQSPKGPHNQLKAQAHYMTIAI